MNSRIEQFSLEIEELEERIAPATVSISNRGVSGSSTITTGGGAATGSGSLTINQTGMTLSGSLPT